MDLVEDKKNPHWFGGFVECGYISRAGTKDRARHFHNGEKRADSIMKWGICLIYTNKYSAKVGGHYPLRLFLPLRYPFLMLMKNFGTTKSDVNSEWRNELRFRCCPNQRNGIGCTMPWSLPLTNILLHTNRLFSRCSRHDRKADTTIDPYYDKIQIPNGKKLAVILYAQTRKISLVAPWNSRTKKRKL